MSFGFSHPDECDRARELASRRLDGDLTEFDIGVLKTHLRDCAECTEVTQAMERMTHRIRGSRLLEPGPARPTVVSAARPRPAVGPPRAGHGGAIAATAAAAGAGALVASHSEHTSARQLQPTTLAELAPLDHQFRSIREGKLLLVLPAPRVRSPHRRGIFV